MQEADGNHSTRRGVLHALAGLGVAAVLPIPAQAATRVASDVEMKRYYAFLWCEMQAAGREIGVGMLDAATLQDAGGHAGYRQTFDAALVRQRASAILGMGDRA